MLFPIRKYLSGRKSRYRNRYRTINRKREIEAGTGSRMDMPILENGIESFSPDQGCLPCTSSVETGMEISDMERFALHISRYTGQTITVFVCGGGPSGMGFTGVLSNVCREYIELLSIIGPPPSCSLPYDTAGKYASLALVGSVTYIPIKKITAFSHIIL